MAHVPAPNWVKSHGSMLKTVDVAAELIRRLQGMNKAETKLLFAIVKDKAGDLSVNPLERASWRDIKDLVAKQLRGF